MPEIATPTARKLQRKVQISLPADMKTELGIPMNAMTDRAAIESLPEVQEALAEFQEAEGIPDIPTLPVTKIVGGATPGVSHAKNQERNFRIVELYQMGLTPETILKHINSNAMSKGWAALKVSSSVNKIVSEYFLNQKPPVRELKAHEEGLKEAMFSSMSRLAEQMSLYISKRNSKNDWAKFEYAAAMEALFRMRQNLVDNRNWNASKMNPLIAVQMNNTHLNIFDKNAEAVVANRKLLQPVIDLLDECLEISEKAKQT